MPRPALVDRPESPPSWRKSSWSFANTYCVEVARLSDCRVGVRDSKDPCGAILCFTRGEWHEFLGDTRNGEFD